MLSTRLPAEILVDIFGYHLSHSLYIDEEKKTPNFLTPTSPHLILTQVCREWRSLILSIKRFWTCICLGKNGGAPYASFFNKQREVLEVWAERARDKRLSLVLVFKEHPEDKVGQKAAKLLIDSVTSYSSRLAHLDARCPSSFMQPLARAISNHSPTLLVLFLELSHHRNNIDELPVISISKFANLKTLRVEGGVKLQLNGADLMCKHLEHLAYNQNIHRLDLHLTLNDAYKVLACCPTLESFIFSVCSDEQFVLPTDEPRYGISLPNLVDLDLNTFYKADIGPLLVSMHAENLRQLFINGSHTSGRDDWNYLHEFLDNSCPPLATLSIVGIEITSTSLLRCLELVPCIEYLELDGRVLDRFVVSSLSWTQSEKPEDNLLSEIQFLTIVGASTDYVSVDELVQMVYSRCIKPAYVDEQTEAELLVLDKELRLRLPMEFLKVVKFSAAHPSVVDYVPQQKMAWGFSSDPIIKNLVDLGYLDVIVDDCLWCVLHVRCVSASVRGR